ncbi:HNH endonuclease family protein [Nocardiopsis sp. CT-R113]|uniref:HNH endonuclease family protein n=1 Tax=Nocardiopsis codii TaxID=3065942 RepID=A0ABU7KAR7_9ACTN|nr:HNH endonuclease family protein [Nocardiopsis sp. CT-R113]MEE2039334.1 HNH endonuclease family protein [Nocardiopsis sp. CT-R113]
MRPSALTATVGALSLAVLVIAPATAHATAPVPLADAVAALPVAAESREGYDRSLFPHWIDEDGDGCNTRMEVLIAEATVAPEADERCRLTGGEWLSYYDDRVHTEARGLDIDHMVPLAEAWDSGASEWTTARRRDYANDLGEEVALVAVTARENRAKADKDPAQWLPPSEAALCRYVTEWTTVKTRWSLTVDQAEADTLTAAAAECPDSVVDTEPAA